MFYLNLQGAFIIAEPEDEDGLDAGYVSFGKIGNLWFSVISAKISLIFIVILACSTQLFMNHSKIKAED